jgi:hypothetical protein
MERSCALKGTRRSRSRRSVEPIAWPPSEKLSSGPLVAKVRPARSASSHASWLNAAFATET